jgi:Leucine-rich repeat (LRR) protein
MSTPEWMKKFQEIGQKGEEEVTAVGDNGFVKTGEQRQADNVSPDNSGEEDAAALFYGAGSPKPRGGSDPPEDESSSEEGSSEEESYEDSSDGVNSEDAIDEPPENETETSGMPSTTTGYSSGLPSTTDSGVPSTTTGSSSLPFSTETRTSTSGVRSITTATSEELGESWVQNRDSDINSQAAAEISRESFNPGESFITEEVLVDEDGNEILVDENGNEIPADEDVDEVQVDENGDEIQEEGEEVLVDENDEGLVPNQEQDVNRQEVDYGFDRGENARALPSETPRVYDVEEQKRILGVGKKSSKSRMSWCIPLLVFAMIVASILLVIFLVVYNEDREVYGLPPTMAPTQTKYGQNDNVAAGTTVFDRLRNNCSLDTPQPNFIDQCNCLGSVDILNDDVRARWESLVQSFIPPIYPEWNEKIDSCSAENQALLWLSSGINNGGEISDLLRLQRLILAVVFFQQGGIKWSRTTNWLSEKNVCEWEGVGCDDEDYVQILNLDQNEMTGELSDAPTKLNAIEAYYAANNDLVGSISSAYFNGNSLRYIDFGNNALSGGFSSDISEDTKLFAVNVASNSLDGSIPQQIEKISGLQILNIESNSFSGKFPVSLYTLPLTELSIGGNEFTGAIPGNLPNISTLTSISLGPNMFTGDIPTNLSQLTALKRLSMVGISDLNGRLPASYGLNLTDLVELSISGTNLDGDIPYQYTDMTNLETLRLSNNNIRGRIIPQLGLLTNLKSLSLDGNVLTGMIPSELGLLTSIQELKLHDNEIYGTIPDEFGNLLEIETLTFDNTFMDGRVPDGVCALRNAELNKLIVDCPTLVGQSQVDGIICSIPDCCTECL